MTDKRIVPIDLLLPITGTNTGIGQLRQQLLGEKNNNGLEVCLFYLRVACESLSAIISFGTFSCHLFLRQGKTIWMTYYCLIMNILNEWLIQFIQKKKKKKKKKRSTVK